MGSALKWGLFGAAAGVWFPVLGVWLPRAQQAATARPAIAWPVLWLCAAAPVLFGLFGALCGGQIDRLRRSLQRVEALLGERTRELHAAAVNVEDQVRKRGELVDELYRTVQVFEQAIDVLDMAFAMYDADERLVLCNRAFLELNDLPRDTVSRRLRYEEIIRLLFAIHPEFGSTLREGTGVEDWLQERLVEFRNPRGPIVMWNGTSWIRLDDKKTADGGTVTTRTDVTSLKLAEFEARLQGQRLKLAATSAGIGIWETDLLTNRVVWDARMEDIHGFAPGSFPGTLEAWKCRIHPDDLAGVEASIALSLNQEGSDFQDTYRIIIPNGEVRHIDRRGSYTKDSHGQLVRRLGVNMDITEHVEKAAALRVALSNAQAATRAKAEFLATMSHEIRTPMNGIIGMTELLLDTALDASQREQAHTIRASGDALLAIINDILDFSKIEAGKLTLEDVPFSFAQVVAESVALFEIQARSQGIELLHALPDTPSDVLGDPGRVRQILLNLISNSIKFTKVGHVKVRLAVHRMADTQLGLEMEVADTGIGMSEEYLARLGEAFSQADTSTTRHFGGTGLGLSICRNLIQLMGGVMTVRSTPGEGTSFLVTLSMQATDPVPSARTEAVQAALSARLKRVLVAEDNVVNQRIILSMLKKCAEQVDLAVDGREAYEKFQQAEYDCIFMDGQMPNMDGLEATRLIRAYEVKHNRRRTPIIALTASAMATDRDVFLAAGMDEYVTKPVRTRELVAALARVGSVAANG